MDEEQAAPDGFDLGEAMQIIDKAEVLVIGFGWLSERLLVDNRRSIAQGPYVQIVGPVANPQERIRELRELRPAFGDPESFVFLPWAGRVDAFVESGLYDRILERNGDDPTAIANCTEAIRNLRAKDAADLREAIFGGEKYHTLYDRRGTDD